MGVNILVSFGIWAVSEIDCIEGWIAIPRMQNAVLGSHRFYLGVAVESGLNFVRYKMLKWEIAGLWLALALEYDQTTRLVF